MSDTTANVPEAPAVERLHSSAGIPKARRGRTTTTLAQKFKSYGIDIDAEIEWVKANLGEASGFTNIPSNLAYLARVTYGVDVSARRVGDKGIAAEVWMEWPSFEDENGDLFEDTDTVKANLNR